MPEIRRGATLVSRLPRVAGEISEVRRGDTLIWNKSGLLRDDFSRTPGGLGSTWTDVSAFLATQYPLSVDNNQCARIGIPDGLTVLGKQTAASRYNVATATGDNGFIETRPMSLGDVFYASALFGRVSNSGNFDYGMGMYLSAGHAYICTRLLGVNAIVADGGTFQPGDRLRLSYSGWNFALTNNGKIVGTFADSLHGSKQGSAYRSMAMIGEGAKDLLDFGTFKAGPRRFSPALDYVMMGNAA